MNSIAKLMPKDAKIRSHNCRGLFRHLVQLVASAGLLAGCSSATVSPERLTGLLQEQVQYLPEDHLDLLLGEMKSKEMVFLGEVHHVPELQRAADDLVTGLACTRPVVYAWEMCYSLSPFYEAASLGRPNPLSPEQPIPPQIVAFNATNIPARWIMVIALDVEHPIYHSKEHPTRYLTEMATRSTSATAREALQARIPRLTATKMYDEVREYLQEIKHLFQEHADTFSAADQEEIGFALDLFEASNRYQHASQGLIKITEDPGQLRTQYYVKTIDRAHQKARQRNAMLVSQIGSRHVSLFDTCEVKHFAIENPATRGKVTSIQMLPVYDEPGKESTWEIDLAAAVKPLMKPGHYCYLPLPSLHGGARRALKYSYYFPGNRPVCDGLLFVRAAKPPRT